MRSLFVRLLRDETGASIIEFSIVMVLFFLLTFGLVEFGYALFQWNSASKAAQLGARMAAVSDPVWSPLTTLTSTGTPGGPWQTNYSVTCWGTNASGTNGTCSGTAPGGVSLAYSAANMQRLVFGRGGDLTCGTIGADGDPGMCDIFWRITPQNVRVNYRHTELGFAGRPGGPVPTVTLTITGLTYQFFALGGLMGFDEITMPDFTVTMTGEDLSAAGVN
ncbi:TadE/TadG family type IV pilus assembly protein [Dongia deserti]|uniref:TadE/TadG family type IV pilus assembly protein n=1 Tax=Dongia deserti TaxID=2268030 RepID=UPI0013C4F70F|nr:TadE family protein [Dongia deserti]